MTNKTDKSERNREIASAVLAIGGCEMLIIAGVDIGMVATKGDFSWIAFAIANIIFVAALLLIASSNLSPD